MTPRESVMLNDLLGKVQQTRVPNKDPEAAAAIDKALGSDPDALYVLTQVVLVQKIALDQAKGQLDQLRQQATSQQQEITDLQQRAAKRSGSFLGNLLGYDDAARTPNPEPPAAVPSELPAYPAPVYPHSNYASQAYASPSSVPPYQPVQGYGAEPGNPGYSGPYSGSGVAAPPASGPGGVAAPSAGGSGSWGTTSQFSGEAGGPPSFLRSAATTAAAVAAGALAFEGVESLLHGFGHGGYGGGLLGAGGYGLAPAGETVINNYYDDAPAHLREQHEHEASYDERPDSFLQGDDGGHETGSHVDPASLKTASYDSASDPVGDETMRRGSRGAASTDRFDSRDAQDDLSDRDPGADTFNTAFGDANDHDSNSNLSDDGGSDYSSV